MLSSVSNKVAGRHEKTACVHAIGHVRSEDRYASQTP